MSRNQEALVDIIEAIKLILQYAEGVDINALAANTEKQDAILRRITIIGEATKRLSLDFREKHPSIPWKQIAGMRDVLTHDYDEVDLDEVWTVINENLPQLLNYIEPLISNEN
ncbi:HepT-like ribonuclease domain-containing protein [Egbenema bharatensis]|uniref:HepT-like ribonuclease domain-containing protein n=1 Tax=Egbenema bharatensis TaxID=3463334 RepID=UPI003A8AB8D0